MADTSTDVHERSRVSFRAKADMAFQTLNDINRKLEDLKVLIQKKNADVNELSGYEVEEGMSQDQSRIESMEALRAEIAHLGSKIRYVEDEVNHGVLTFDCLKQSLCGELLCWKEYLTEEASIFSANKILAPSLHLRKVLSGRRPNLPAPQPLEDQMAGTEGPSGPEFISQGIPSSSSLASTSRGNLAPSLEDESQLFGKETDILFEILHNISKNLLKLGNSTKSIRQLESGLADDSVDLEGSKNLFNPPEFAISIEGLSNGISCDVIGFDDKAALLAQKLLSLTEGLNYRLTFVLSRRLRKSSAELTRELRVRFRGVSSRTKGLSPSLTSGGQRGSSHLTPRAGTGAEDDMEEHESGRTQGNLETAGLSLSTTRGGRRVSPRLTPVAGTGGEDDIDEQELGMTQGNLEIEKDGSSGPLLLPNEDVPHQDEIFEVLEQVGEEDAGNVAFQGAGYDEQELGMTQSNLEIEKDGSSGPLLLPNEDVPQQDEIFEVLEQVGEEDAGNVAFQGAGYVDFYEEGADLNLNDLFGPEY